MPLKMNWGRAAALALCLPLAVGCNLAASAEENKPNETNAPSAGRETSVKEVETVTLKAEPYASAIEATGKALPVRESFLSSEVPGKIRQILVKQGDWVKKGQVLLRFDQLGFSLGLQQAKAHQKAAETQVNQLKLELDRLTGLVAKEAAPTAQLDQLQAQYQGALAQAQMAAVGVEQAGKALADSVLRAPYAGMIAEILQEEGNYCPAMPPTMLVKIVDTSSLEVQAFLPEEVASAVSVGQAVKVSVESAGIEAAGQIIFVSNRLDERTQTLEIRARLENPDGKIKGGAFTRVRIAKRVLENAILVPVKAVLRDEENRPFAFVAEGGRAKRVPVSVGETDGLRVVVLSGLAPGQELITSLVSEMEDGAKVSVKGKKG